MNKTEFLEELRASLEGDVPGAVIAENIGYYDNYISGEIASGRNPEEIFEELGDPRLIARTIIASNEAAEGDGPREGATYTGGYGPEGRENPGKDNVEDSNPNFHYVDLNKWYWKAVFIGAGLLVLYLLLMLVGGIFVLLFRFGGPILLALLLWTFIRRLF